MVKKFRRYLYSFWHNSRTWQTHRHTHTDTAWRYRPRLCIASRGKNDREVIYLYVRYMVPCDRQRFHALRQWSKLKDPAPSTCCCGWTDDKWITRLTILFLCCVWSDSQWSSLFCYSCVSFVLFYNFTFYILKFYILQFTFSLILYNCLFYSLSFASFAIHITFFRIFHPL